MKFHFLIFFTLMILSAVAQESGTSRIEADKKMKTSPIFQKNIIKTQPAGIVLGKYNFSYETVINPKRSIEIRGEYISKAWDFQTEHFLGKRYVHYKGYNFGVEYRFYLPTRDCDGKKSVHAPIGNYFAPYAHFTKFDADWLKGSEAPDPDDFLKSMGLGLGVAMGKQKIFFNKFTFNIFGGLGLTYYDIDRGMEVDPERNFEKRSVMPVGRIGVSVGYAFKEVAFF